jgi:hypothetical protein
MKIKILFVLVLIFSQQLYAQFQFDSNVLKKQSWNSCLAVADINNDGLDDIISPSRAAGVDTVYIILNCIRFYPF